jgi:ATP/maltotriose-dependent transcriptional regulator MalT
LVDLKIEEKKYDEAGRFLNEGVKSAKEKSLRVDYIANLKSVRPLAVLQKNYTKAKPIWKKPSKLRAR